MRTKDQPIRAPALLTAAALLLASTCAGCASQREWGNCGLIGAMVGGLAGGAAGVAITNYTRGGHSQVAHEDESIGAGIGGGVLGALIGAEIGHELCDPEVSTTTRKHVTYYRAPMTTYGTTGAMPPPPNP
jgi:hypothetical protein